MTANSAIFEPRCPPRSARKDRRDSLRPAPPCGWRDRARRRQWRSGGRLEITPTTSMLLSSGAYFRQALDGKPVLARFEALGELAEVDRPAPVLSRSTTSPAAFCRADGYGGAAADRRVKPMIRRQAAGGILQRGECGEFRIFWPNRSFSALEKPTNAGGCARNSLCARTGRFLPQEQGIFSRWPRK